MKKVLDENNWREELNKYIKNYKYNSRVTLAKFIGYADEWDMFEQYREYQVIIHESENPFTKHKAPWTLVM